jgi:hypothetical protein
MAFLLKFMLILRGIYEKFTKFLRDFYGGGSGGIFSSQFSRVEKTKEVLDRKRGGFVK